MEYTYITQPCCQVDDHTYELCSELYSDNYGVYSGEDKVEKKGKPIRFPVRLYKEYYSHNKNMFVSLCYQGAKLIGHAFFLRKELEGYGICAWVTQLVVHYSHRNRGVGSSLLQSAWGFSNYYSWGLATANAITVKTLESVTWREVRVDKIKENISVIEKLLADIPFADADGIDVHDCYCQIYSNFYPKLELVNNKEEYKVYTKRLGKINPGNEWLAFTFNAQPMVYSEKNFKKFLDFSEKQLQDAYGRMDMPLQNWTRGTCNELDYILSNIETDSRSSIMDLGCGQGRHSIELLKRGYLKTESIDFSEKLIEKAKCAAEVEGVRGTFFQADARKLKLGRKFNLILCLYDVVGSFRDEKDNVSILRTIKSHLASNGIAVISVMNMELTRHKALHVGSLKDSPEMLLRLPPSNTMARTGNIFNPDFYMINTDDGLVYRKEQFDRDGLLATEYVLADKRYTAKEISDTVNRLGFKIQSLRYVQAGHWDKELKPTDDSAKEILLFLSH